MLLQELHSERSRPVLLFPGEEPYTRGHVMAWAERAETQAWLARFEGANVGVCCNENSDLALALLLLDGVASRITLLPQGLDSNTFESLTHSARIGILVGDGISAPPSGIPLAEPIPRLARSECRPATPIPEPVSTEWVLPTSGTTKQPKLVAHTVGTLARSVKRDMLKGEKFRWGLLYDLNRFAGVQVFLQAILGGASIIIPEKSTPLDQKLREFAKAGCNALSATPTLWRKILMTPGADEIPLKLITLGGEIADQSILSALNSAFPTARTTHIYASTEAGVGFSVSDGIEGFPADYLSGALAGVSLRISSDNILEIKPGIQGQKYLGESSELAEEDGFISTGDRVEVKGNRVFFLGRSSGAINVGGNKVQPEKVENVILAHPEVAMVSVIAKKSGITGALVEARVVMKRTSATPPAALLREWCAHRLERHEVPALFRVVDDLETNATGKISRQ